MKNLDPKVKKSAKKILNLATRSKRSMQVNQMNYVRTAKFISTEARSCLLYTSPSPRDRQKSRMPSSA